MSLPPIAYPGLSLASSSLYIAGPGTHVYGSSIHASVAGHPFLSLAPETPSPTPASTSASKASVKKDAASAKQILSVIRGGRGAKRLPEVDSIVLGRVTRVQRERCTIGIAVVDGEVINSGVAGGEGMTGVVRKEDVRGMEKDKVVMGEMFRVGDLVRGVVISLGDQSNYYLSTARNELGVLMAKSENGNTMVPISWKEFMDESTGEREGRKVAKPF